MSSLDDIRSARLKKLALLKEAFGEVYPARTSRSHSVDDFLKKFSQFLRSKKKVTLAGRIRSLRTHGGATFADLEEENKRVQIFLRREDIGEKPYAIFTDAVGVGDIIECTGRADMTKRKEHTLLVTHWRPLAKTLRPLPEKWHGLQDVEERYRTRALDLLSNESVRAIFARRAKIITALRAYFDGLGFFEVETPVLQALAGGAAARPFQTHHNALAIDLYLRIAPELYLKRLLVGGFSRVYEIGRNFRNEGIDVTHNPEFTMLEAYVLYEDYTWLMGFIEAMMEKIAKSAGIAKKEFSYQGKSISLKRPFKRISFYEALKRYALLSNVETMPKNELIIAAKRLGLTLEGEPGEAEILESIFRKSVRPYLTQPTFVFDWPREILPLTKQKEKNPKLVESFQLYIGGLELVKAFSELNDPEEQRRRFLEQDEQRQRGNEEAAPIDEDFLKNLEYGMPPSAGFGLGIDRLTLLFTDMHNIRDVILFPILRPEN